MKKNKENLATFAESIKRKTMKMASNSVLDDALYLWFAQKRSQGNPYFRSNFDGKRARLK